MTPPDPAIALAQLGFSTLEATAYAHLLQEGPATAYRVAQALGKPVANTYAAVESLQAKGALLAVDGEPSRLVRAVEPAELLAGMRRAYSDRCAAAEESLASLPRHSGDERVYTLRTREQVIERARRMLGSCRETAVLDVFPGFLGELKPDLERAAARGVGVGLIVYEPVEVAGAQVVLHARPELIATLWPGESIVLVTDAMEHLTALVGRGGAVNQALWTASLFLSVLHHDGLVCQMLTQSLDQALAGRMTFEELRAARERARAVSITRTPGLAKVGAGTREGAAHEPVDDGGRGGGGRGAGPGRRGAGAAGVSGGDAGERGGAAPGAGTA